jgi:hypothetical protein
LIDYLFVLFALGTQRFFFLLFRQDNILSQKKLEESEILFEPRGGMSLMNWATQSGMGLPVGVNGFTTNWTGFCDKIHEEIALLPPPDFRSASQLEKYGRSYPDMDMDDTSCCDFSGCCGGNDDVEGYNNSNNNDRVTSNNRPTSNLRHMVMEEETPLCSFFSCCSGDQED